ncbi:MAG TPA: hypothetical protein VGN01_20200 [Acidobacteriaceae bacterium]
MSRALAAVLALLQWFAGAALVANAQDAKPAITAAVSVPQVTFSFDRPGLPVPKYRLTIQEDGATVYEGEAVWQGSGSTSVSPPQPFRSAVKISPATAGRIIAMGRQLNHFNINCSTKAKNIANTGTKVLSYSAPDGSGSCTYNYSDNKDVESLTETIQGIAETLDRGRELDHLHRFDRLGLDSAIIFLSQEVTEGHALELGTIVVSLRSIASDPELIERVRNRAGKLLALIPGEAPLVKP